MESLVGETETKITRLRQIMAAAWKIKQNKHFDRDWGINGSICSRNRKLQTTMMMDNLDVLMHVP